jgi:hypothetical protein
MNESFKGQWVARFVQPGNPGDRPVTKAHLVESEIEDRAVTACGRQMHRERKRGVLFPAPDAETCSQCGSEPDL